MSDRSNSRRFVNAAWSLLTFQVIASVGAVAVTGLAAFHVRDLIGAQQAGGPVMEATPEPGQESTNATPAPVPAQPAYPTPAAPAAQAAPAEAPPPPPPPAPVNDGGGALTLTNNGQGTIISSLYDPDGVSQHSSYQWLRDGTVIQGANGANYSFLSWDAGHTITARVDYIDGDGFTESASQAIFIPLIIQ